MGVLSKVEIQQEETQQNQVSSIKFNMSDKVAVVAKPQMRNLLWSVTKRNLAVAVGVGIAVSLPSNCLSWTKRERCMKIILHHMTQTLILKEWQGLVSSNGL